MIVTVDNAKTLLQISVSTYDTLIKKLIPIVENKIVNYCNNEFISIYEAVNGIMPTVYVWGSEISFNSSTNRITDEGETIDFSNFRDGDSIRVYNSLHNNGPLTIEEVTVNYLLIDDTNTLVQEEEGNTIIIARISWPADLELVAAQMIKYNMQKQGYFKQEKIDDYSYTLDDIVSGYPRSIMQGLTDYVSAFYKTIPTNTLYYRQV